MRFFSKTFFATLFALVLIGFALLMVRSSKDFSPSPEPSSSSSSRISPELAAEVARIEATEQKLNETVWAKEILAQQCGETFESLWNALNSATNKLKIAGSFSAGEVVIGEWNTRQSLPHGIDMREPAGLRRTLSPDEWRRSIEEFERAGWELVQIEFRHNRFETDDAGRPRQSRFYFSAHLTNPAHSQRTILEGDLLIDWAEKHASDEMWPVKQADASRLTIKTRRGEPPFQPILVEQIIPPENSFSIGPLIVHDLDLDGFPEIILAAKNLVYRRRSGDRYEPQPLCRYSPGLITTALIADFDSDGAADFLCHRFEGLFLFKGSPQGVFDEPERKVWPAPPNVKYPMVLTCGDIDRDGDLDIFVGQYKVPYERGAMPTPYHDAKDGNPAYLLLNDGNGNFSDATAASGESLRDKRSRRTYSASFVDLDNDNHVDLLVVSDFAGADVYRNNGRGQFADVTGEWIVEPHAFGMAHAVADFNVDGRLDLLMIGMTSPTVERLEHLNLWRPGVAEDRSMRARMTVGNRLYIANSTGGFEQTALSASIARSGWSWGCSAFDFDNDGFPDVYIANGLESRQSVHDYESEYWLHDAYVGDSAENSAAYLYFGAQFARTRGRGQSYGGYEKNRLYLNRHGAAFVEIGHLLGVSLEQDSRNVVSADLNADGRMDLLVTSFEAWPEAKQTLRVYKNTLENTGNWIGFDFQEKGAAMSVGAQVTVHYNGRTAVRHVLNGDSYRSQHPHTLHFGLGAAGRVERVEIRWTSGETLILREPVVNRYHAIQTRQ